VSSRMSTGRKASVSGGVNTDVPKVLHKVCGRPMLGYVLDACRQGGIERMYVVVGYGADKVKKTFDGEAGIIWVEQAEQLGTAHAVLCCEEHLKDFDGLTFVLCGDGPLVRPEVLKELVETHNSGSAAVLATAILDEPTGYGRIIRDSEGNIEAIVEHGDCTDEQLKIREVNPSYYLFDNRLLFDVLKDVDINERKGEYYLTDAVEILIKRGYKVSAIAALRAEEAMSVNTQRQLEQLDRIMSERLGDSGRLEN